MNFKKLAGATALPVVLLLAAGCSSDSDSNGGTDREKVDLIAEILGNSGINLSDAEVVETANYVCEQLDRGAFPDGIIRGLSAEVLGPTFSYDQLDVVWAVSAESACPDAGY